jgi:hypothetical protein
MGGMKDGMITKKILSDIAIDTGTTDRVVYIGAGRPIKRSLKRLLMTRMVTDMGYRKNEMRPLINAQI